MDGWIHGPVRWLADAGCPADLIGLNVMTAGDIGMIEQANGAICFNTANGTYGRTRSFLCMGVAHAEEIASTSSSSHLPPSP